MLRMQSTRNSREVRHTIVASLLSLGILGVAACDSPSDDGDEELEFGTYSLVSVNGQNLPFAVTTALGNLVVQSASLQLTAGAGSNPPTYTATVTGTDDGQPATLIADAGGYSRTGGSLTFSSSALPGLTYVGTFSSNVLTITVPGASIGATGTISMRFEK